MYTYIQGNIFIMQIAMYKMHMYRTIFTMQWQELHMHKIIFPGNQRNKYLTQHLKKWQSWFICSQRLKLFGFLTFWLWAFLMNPETCTKFDIYVLKQTKRSLQDPLISRSSI